MRISSLVLLCVLTACQANGPVQMTDADRAQIVQSIEGQAEGWAAIANGLDAAPLAALVTEDVEVVDFMNHYVGVNEYVEGAQGLFNNFQAWTTAWDETHIEVLSPDAAVLEGRFTVRRQRMDGRWQESSPYIYMTAIFRLVGEEWKITRAHLSGSLRVLEDAG